jgi:predicted Na+-dependent transporter
MLTPIGLLSGSDSDRVVLISGIHGLLIGLGFLIVAAYVGLSSRERLQRHRRLSKLKDRHLGELFATGILFSSFSAVFLIKWWFSIDDEKSELEAGLTVGLVLVALLAGVALFAFRILSKLRD